MEWNELYIEKLIRFKKKSKVVNNNREKMEKMRNLRTNYTNPKLYEARRVSS